MRAHKQIHDKRYTADFKELMRIDVQLMCPFVLSQHTPLKGLINEQAAKTSPATVIHLGTCDLSSLPLAVLLVPFFILYRCTGMC